MAFIPIFKAKSISGVFHPDNFCDIYTTSESIFRIKNL
uniref:Uncharacterized protein n=1 Tax=uncultured Desulfobacterium sp. TaxID=201089 RepID=E1YBN8_9BACT|nr:unknown protein [uncultured Desulfobacterium sp.]